MGRSSSKIWFSGADLLRLGFLGLLSCAPDPGRADVRFEWEGGRPTFAQDVFLLLQVEADGAVIARSGPKVLRQGEPLDLPPVPHGEGRTLLAEILTSRFTNSLVLWAGRSGPFDLEPGQEVDVAVSLRPTDSGAPRPPGPPPPDASRIIYELRPYRTELGDPRYLIEGAPGAAEAKTRIIAFSAKEVASATELQEVVTAEDGSFSMLLPVEVAPSLDQVYVGAFDAEDRLSDAAADPDLQATLVADRLLVTSVGADTPHVVRRSAAFDLQARVVADELGGPVDPVEADRLIAADGEVIESRADAVWRDRTRTQDTVGPGPRTRHGMAFDRARNRVVLFGGYTENRELRTDTWALDRLGWRRIGATGPAPSARFGHRMTYDVARDEVVLFGGASNDLASTDTWVFDGRQWRVLETDPAPPPRVGHAMAYDPVRRVTVLFGGRGEAEDGSSVMLDDTWVFDGETWSPVPVASGPPARFQSAMAYLEELDRIVLFGGRDFDAEGIELFDDTWVFDGASRTWQKLSLEGPPARDRHDMVFDTSLGGLVLFGGEGPPSQTRSDAWLFDGDAWSELPDHGVSARLYHEMAGAIGGFWLVGGQSDAEVPAPLGDVQWVSQGAAEAVDLGQEQPPPRSAPAITYDPARALILLYGGVENDLSVRRWYSDAWTWDGTSWNEVDSGGLPALEYPRLAFEEASETVILTGKSSSGMETWRWDGTVWEPAISTTATAAWGALPSRSDFGMGRDPASQGVVVFGGRTEAGAVNTLLALRPEGWRTVPTSDGPDPRYGFGFASSTDAGTEALLVFAGREPLSRLPPFVFVFDGVDWTSIEPLGATPWPAARAYPGMAYDPQRRRNFLFGGEDVQQFEDLWEWSTNAGQWWPIPSASVLAPPGRFDHAQVFFPDQQQMLLFGGCIINSCEASLGDTWLLERSFEMQPALLADVRVGLTGEVLQSLEIAFVGGATGYSLDLDGFGAEAPGLDVYLWDFVRGRWMRVGSTTEAASSTERTVVLVDSGANELVADGRVHLALAGRAGLGNGMDSARLRLDALEIRVRSSRP